MAAVFEFVHLTNDCVVFSRVPFDYKTSTTYLIAFILQFIAMTSLYLFGGFIVSLEIGCYLVVMAFVDDIINDVRSINKVAQTKKIRSKISIFLHNSIRFHARVKQLRLFSPEFLTNIHWKIQFVPLDWSMIFRT